MNVFYLLKTLYTDGVTNGAISIDTKEKPVVWIGSSHPKSILGWTSIFVLKKWSSKKQNIINHSFSKQGTNGHFHDSFKKDFS